MIESPAEVIALLGGRNVVSDLLKRPVTTVASWSARQSIPVDVWPALVAHAAQKEIEGLTYAALVNLHASEGRSTPALPRKRKRT